MKLAVMVRGYIPVPRPQDVVYVIIDLAQIIAEELAKRGHQVDFYAPDGSRLKLPAKVRSFDVRPLVKSRADLNKLLGTKDLFSHYLPALWDQFFASEMFRRAIAGEYDLLHFHHPESAISLAPLFPTVPVAYTLHDTLHTGHPEIFELFASSNQYCISISDRQRKFAPKLPYAATIHNGVDTQKFTYSAKDDGYMLFVGRIIPEKGASEAVRIARRTGEKLIIIGPVLPENRQYFNKFVKPYIDGEQIIYLGHKTNEETIAYYQKAKCLLFPGKREEPFGMTMIEAMACGTPVVALKRGSVPEVIKDGVTGFVCERQRDLAEAVKKIGQIKRAACREHVMKNFTIRCMVDNYEKVLNSIIKNHAASFISAKVMAEKIQSPQQLTSKKA